VQFEGTELIRQFSQPRLNFLNRFCIVFLFSQLQKNSNLFMVFSESLPVFNYSEKSGSFPQRRLGGFPISPEVWLSYFLVELLNVFLLPSDVKDGSADLTVAFRGLSTARPAHFLPFLYLLLKGTTRKDAAHTIG
jgi:hypothetical protein